MTPEPQPTAKTATFATLLARVWAAVLGHKKLVGAAFAFGLLEAVFTKAPFLLVDPLMRAMGAQTGGGPAVEAPTADASFSDRFAWWFQGQSDVIASWFGRDASSAGGPAMNLVIASALLAALCGVLGGGCIYGLQLTSRFFAIKMVADLRCAIARHLLSLPLRYFGQRRMGELISNVTNDAQVLQRAFELASDNVVVDPLMILANVGVIAFVMPEALYVLVLLIPLMAVPMYRAGRKVRKRSSKTLEAMGGATESMNQILSGIRTVKAFRLEQQRLEEYEAQNATFLERTIRMLRAKSMSMTQTFLGYQVGFGALLMMLGYFVLMPPHVLEFSAVATVMLPLSTTYQHVKRLTRSYNTLLESTSALERIERILHERIDESEAGGTKLPTLRGEVELDGVWFAYGEEPVLRGVSLKVKPGTTVALVGPSGSGKSTTLDLLMRFHDPQKGRILVDGHDLRTVCMDDYRKHTAVVSQQPFLFNSSIRDNIAYGKPGCTQQEIEAAAKAANIHDFVTTLPEGYDTLAGERGCNLSGGQMQRITIARAIVRDPAILFLDEATSSLDSENEELVQRALDNLRHGRTSFVIAHRLSTITDADLIVVLEQGRIVEMGSHDELVARGGAYKRMRDLQSA